MIFSSDFKTDDKNRTELLKTKTGTDGLVAVAVFNF